MLFLSPCCLALMLLPCPCACPAAAATFVFQNPAIFEASSELGDITGLYMEDDEGTIQVGIHLELPSWLDLLPEMQKAGIVQHGGFT